VIDRSVARRRRKRTGFAMLTVLWVITVATISTIAFALTGRVSIDAARNRVHHQRAYWLAIGCARKTQSTIDATLRDAINDAAANRAWRTLDAIATSASHDTACTIALEAAGTRIDINTATDEMLLRLAADQQLPNADALVARIDSARDSTRSVVLLDDDRHLRALLSSLAPSFDSTLTTEPGRLSLANAPASALVATPGISRETADAIVDLRTSNGPLDALTNILGHLSATAADSLIARFPDAQRLTTPDPDAWLLRVSASSGTPPATVALQWRLVRVGRQTRAIAFRVLS